MMAKFLPRKNKHRGPLSVFGQIVLAGLLAVIVVILCLVLVLAMA